MIENVKPIDTLKIQDLQTFPVWQYTGREGQNETYVRPASRLPISNVVGKVFGVQARLANGAFVWSLIGNVDLSNARMNDHFLTITVEKDGKWFGLARYHDFDFSERGPLALSQFLEIPIDEIFPITYDLRKLVRSESAMLRGQILKEPRERLSRSEIIAMAVP